MSRFAQKHKHMNVITREGKRTSVSIPEVDVDLYVVGFCNSQRLFRRHLNAAVLETVVRPGRSFSEAVRDNLNLRLKNVMAMAA
jgi:hypothetical protein